MPSQILRRCCVAALSATLAACSTIYQPTNVAITEVDEDQGYRRLGNERWDEVGDSLILLAFSGGGTRAAALSYGVMQELRDTVTERDGRTIRLLDEVDTISSVSGGSFVSAYYGLYRDGLFENFEDDFLRRSVQSDLIKGLLNPAQWYRSMSSGFDRTEMAIDYYDRTIFKGATFADISAQGSPYIDINATDLTTGLRFTFSQELFDLICTDLDSFSVARAVTASSAVPVAFPTIVLENHAAQCDVSDTDEWQMLTSVRTQGETQESLRDGLMSYRDYQKRAYIHLVDGGIADNLGLRAMIDRVEGLGETRFPVLEKHGIKNVLIVLVNAQVKPEDLIEKSPEKPSASATMGAYTSAQMDRYNQETKDRLRENLEQLEQNTRAAGLGTRIFFAEVSFDQVQVEEVSRFLNSMPTSLELEDDEVDRLILSGRALLRHDPAFVEFVERTGARRAPGAIGDREICAAFGQADCSAFLETREF